MNKKLLTLLLCALNVNSVLFGASSPFSSKNSKIASAKETQQEFLDRMSTPKSASPNHPIEKKKNKKKRVSSVSPRTSPVRPERGSNTPSPLTLTDHFLQKHKLRSSNNRTPRPAGSPVRPGRGSRTPSPLGSPVRPASSSRTPSPLGSPVRPASSNRTPSPLGSPVRPASSIFLTPSNSSSDSSPLVLSPTIIEESDPDTVSVIVALPPHTPTKATRKKTLAALSLRETLEADLARLQAEKKSQVVAMPAAVVAKEKIDIKTENNFSYSSASKEQQRQNLEKLKNPDKGVVRAFKALHDRNKKQIPHPQAISTSGAPRLGATPPPPLKNIVTVIEEAAAKELEKGVQVLEKDVLGAISKTPQPPAMAKTDGTRAFAFVRQRRASRVVEKPVESIFTASSKPAQSVGKYTVTNHQEDSDEDSFFSNPEAVEMYAEQQRLKKQRKAVRDEQTKIREEKQRLNANRGPRNVSFASDPVIRIYDLDREEIRYKRSKNDEYLYE